jgi:hypothetical protein
VKYEGLEGIEKPARTPDRLFVIEMRA